MGRGTLERTAREAVYPLNITIDSTLVPVCNGCAHSNIADYSIKISITESHWISLGVVHTLVRTTAPARPATRYYGQHQLLFRRQDVPVVGRRNRRVPLVMANAMQACD